MSDGRVKMQEAVIVLHTRGKIEHGAAVDLLKVSGMDDSQARGSLLREMIIEPRVRKVCR